MENDNQFGSPFFILTFSSSSKLFPLRPSSFKFTKLPRVAGNFLSPHPYKYKYCNLLVFVRFSGLVSRPPDHQKPGFDEELHFSQIRQHNIVNATAVPTYNNNQTHKVLR